MRSSPIVPVVNIACATAVSLCQLALSETKRKASIESFAQGAQHRNRSLPARRYSLRCFCMGPFYNVGNLLDLWICGSSTEDAMDRHRRLS